jgi:hypothetical protein
VDERAIMASEDDGNGAMDVDQEVVVDGPVDAADSPMNGDWNGAGAAAIEAVEVEVSPVEDRADATTDAVDPTGANDSVEHDECVGEQAVQADALMDEGPSGSAAATMEEVVQEVSPAEGHTTDHGHLTDNNVEDTNTNEEQAASADGNADNGADVLMTNDVALEEIGDKVADCDAQGVEAADSKGTSREQEDIQPNPELEESVHVADERHDDGEESDDDDERHHENADERAGDEDNHGHDHDHGDIVHNDDEYDPANPTQEHDGNTFDPSHADDEYDPANPMDGRTNGNEKANETEASPERKRKLSDTATAASAASPAASTTSARSPKRPRNDSTPKVDQRGLKNSAWDRLLDFESSKEFRVAQVSRAAFATIAQLPEFAQCAIVARFTRTPMKDVRDKNELILKLCREYLSENPQVSSLQLVSVFIADAAADPGLFAYGYAPPVPTSGMSTVKIPFRQDKPGTISTPSAPSFSPQKLPKPAVTAAVKPELDEFGREIKPKAAAPSTPSKTQQPTPASTQPTASPARASGKPSDPRRRRQGGADATSSESVRAPATADARGQIEKSDVYNRLPVSVRSRLDGLIAARRLTEAINDNVLSRLNHLPESTAVTAIEKFMEADLGQVGNLNGFLVGIINRVQERAPASDPRNGASITRGAPPNAPGTTHLHPPQQHPPHQPQQHQFSQHAPVGQHDYTRPSAAPESHRHCFEHASGNDYRGHPMQPPMAAAHVGYDARNPLPQPPGYAPDQQLAWTAPHSGAPSPHYTHAGRPAATVRFSSQPTIDQAISKLPVSVQNHLVSLVNSRILPSLEDLSEKCYEVLGQLSEGLANDVLKRFGTANLSTVRNHSAFLMGVVKKCRQEYGFD